MDIFRAVRVAPAVVGHVEWVHFVKLGAIPAPGAIVHGEASWEEPAGGGGAAAVELARLSGECTLFTALGDDHYGRQAQRVLESAGVRVHAGYRREPQRRATTLLSSGERSIILHGPCQIPRGDDPLPYGELSGADCVYFCKGDVRALRQARRARVLVATARILPVLQEAEEEGESVYLDALVRSANDPGEPYEPGDLQTAPGAEVVTDGANGGWYRLADGREGRWKAAPLNGPVADSYGAGDCFAAALAWGLGAGLPLGEAVKLAARRGAAAVCRDGSMGRGKKI